MNIKDKRFMLRPYRKGDEKSLVENLNDGQVSRFMSTMPYPYKIKNARECVNHCLKDAKKKKRNQIVFAIEAGGKLVGAVGLHQIEKNHKAEIGYWVGRKYWNMGLTTKAVALMTDFGFNKLKLKRITAHVFSRNKASARVVEKNGYKFEGLLRRHILKDKKYHDVLLFAKVK